MAAIIAAQLATGVVLDHWGLFRLQQAPFTIWRAAGVALLMAGAALVLKR
jgi:transporter family-2 protein